MTDKLFDQFLKSKLEHYDSGAPMHVWERIKDDKDRRPKGFFFWRNRYILLLAGFLLTGITTYVLLNNNKTVAPPIVKSKTAVGETANQEKLSDESVATSQQLISTKDKVEYSSTNQNQSTNTQTKQDQSNSLITTQVSSNNKSKVAFQKNTNHSNGGVASASLQSSKSKKNSLFTTTSTTVVNNNLVNTSVQEQVLSMAGFFRNNNAKPQFKLGNIAMPQNKPTCPTINGPRRRDFYLEVYVSPDYNVRTISAASDSTNSYIKERNETENYRTSFSGGVRLVKNLGEKTLLKGGINYTQINERLRIVSENSKQLTQIITIRTVVRSPGDTLFVRDTMYYEQTGTRYRTTYNRFRFIDVPVIFSYEFGDPDLMHFAVNAGPVFNIVSFYKGEVLDTSYSPLAISTKTGTNVNNWRNNIGMGAFASVSIFKKLNDRIHLFGEPYVRYNFNPVTQQNNFIKQRYLITGMQLGIRYNFIPPGQRYKR